MSSGLRGTERARVLALTVGTLGFHAVVTALLSLALAERQAGNPAQVPSALTSVVLGLVAALVWSRQRRTIEAGESAAWARAAAAGAIAGVCSAGLGLVFALLTPVRIATERARGTPAREPRVKALPTPGPSVPADVWVTDDSVSAVAVAGDRVFVGGGFRSIGRFTGAFSFVDGRSGRLLGPFSKLRGAVRTAVHSGDGSWFVGGQFADPAMDRTLNLARLGPDGSLDRSWGVTVNGVVEALALVGDRLWVGGRFSWVGGSARQNLAVVDVGAGTLEDWAPEPDDAVFSIVPAGRGVLVGGRFKRIGGQHRSCVAELDGSDGRPTDWNPRVAGSEVLSIAVDGNTVFLGGRFIATSEQRRMGAAAVGLHDMRLLPWDPDVGRFDVRTILPAGDVVYIGGRFNTVSGRGRRHIAAVDRTTGRPTDWDLALEGERVEALLLRGSTLILGGEFSSVGGDSRRNLAFVDVGCRRTVPGSLDGGASGGDVRVLVAAGDSVGVGGRFDSIGATRVPGLAVIDPTRDSVLPVDAGVFRAEALAVADEELYVLGDAPSGACLTAAGPGPPYVFERRLQLNAGGRALAPEGSTVFVGGRFDQANGLRASKLLALDRAAGRLPGWLPEPVEGEGIYALAVSDQRLYLGGRFSRMGSFPRRNLAAVDAHTGALVEWGAATDGPIRAMAQTRGMVFVGGEFSSVDSLPRKGLAALDPQSGAVLPWVADCGSVRALMVLGDALLVGGDFASVRGMPRRGLAALELATGEVTARPLPGVYSVSALAQSGRFVAVGGAHPGFGVAIVRRDLLEP